jgi:hypothetical protein
MGLFGIVVSFNDVGDQPSDEDVILGEHVGIIFLADTLAHGTSWVSGLSVCSIHYFRV